MAAGPELLEYRDTLASVLTDTRSIRRQTEDLRDKLEPASTAAQNYQKFRALVELTDDLIDSAKRSLKLVEKVGPLNKLADAVEKVLNKLEPRVEKLKEKIEEAKTFNSITDKLADAVENTETVIGALVSAEAFLANQLGGTDEIIAAFDRVAPDRGPSREGAAQFNALVGAADAKVKTINDAVDGVRQVIETFDAAEMKVEDFLDTLGLSAFSRINEGFGKLNGIDGLFDILLPVLDAVNVAIKPVEPLLDAVGFIFDIIVTPVINFITNTFGIDALLDKVAGQFEGLLPQVTIFDGFNAQFPVLSAGLDDFLSSDFGIGDFAGLAKSTYGEFTRDSIGTSAMQIGTVAGERLEHDETGAAIDPRGGDDLVIAGGGNDIIAASEGDDTVSGGAGIDRMVFAGELVEYDFAKDEDSGAFIFTHTDPGRGRQVEGSEVVTDVEYFDFGTETFTKLQFDEAIARGSVLNGTNRGELIFLQPEGDRINGYFVANGRGGDDRIQGTLLSDLLRGGAGDDLLIPRLAGDTLNGAPGNDRLNGGPGSDSFQIFDLGFSPQDRIDLEAGTAAVRGGPVLLNSVENITIQHKGNVEILGNARHNVLLSGGGDDVLAGRAGNDQLSGGDKNDYLFGGPGVDWLRGGDGEDVLVAGGRTSGGKAELYDGGAGEDVLTYSTDRNELPDRSRGDPRIQNLVREVLEEAPASTSLVIRTATGEIDRLEASGKVVATDIATGIETYIGSDGADTLVGSLGTYLNPVSILGAGGDDVLRTNGASFTHGGEDDDLVVVTRARTLQPGSVGIEGGRGIDTLDLDRIDGVRWTLDSTGAAGGGSQRLQASDIDNTTGAVGKAFTANIREFEKIRLSDFDDEVFWYTDASDVTIAGGAGNDQMELDILTPSNETFLLLGEDGDDWIRLEHVGLAQGNLGNDRIEVNASNPGGDALDAFGGQGDDLILIARSNGKAFGGAGHDRLVFSRVPFSNGFSEGFGGDLGFSVNVNLRDGTAESLSSSGSIDLKVRGIEEVIATESSDILTGSNRDDTFVGRGGNDLIQSLRGNDRLFGGAGDDTLMGGAGDDLLRGGGGSNLLIGGKGLDTVTYAFAAPNGPEGTLTASAFANMAIDLKAGTATANGTPTDTLRGIENVYGNNRATSITGNSGDNFLSGEAGIDTLRGAGGDDLLSMGGGSIVGLSGREAAFGGPGDDRILLGTWATDADGGQDNDFADFSGDTDLLAGGGLIRGVTADLAAGTYTASVITGQPVWADTGTTETRLHDGASFSPLWVLWADPLYEFGHAVTGLPEADDPESARFRIATERLTGTTEGTISRIENLKGSSGRDILSGDGGANILNGFDGRDVLTGRGGADTLFGGKGADAMHGNQGPDRLVAGDGADTLFGGGAADVLLGGDQRDLLQGGSGADTLNGGNGRDILIGGRGNDNLTGGDSPDTFYFGRGDGDDRILDYDPDRDIIEFGVGSGTESFDDLGIRRAGSDTVLTHVGGSIRLEDVLPGQLDPGQFVFHDAPEPL